MTRIMFETMPGRKRIAVVGGGAAGMMAAIKAAELGASVTIFERNERPGRKLGITGKGRCNVTSDCDRDEFFASVTKNPRFLYSAYSFFSSESVRDFFEGAGVPLKVERGKRVFPVSDKARDIVDALVGECRANGVKILNEKVEHVLTDCGAASGVATRRGNYDFDAVILCTGGRSYSATGSDGSGYKLAAELGHSITDIIPSLVPIVEDGNICASMQGLSLKNVILKIRNNESGKIVFEELGEMMFTHFGLTGPLVLSASAHMRDICKGRYSAEIDLKPALDEKKLDARVLSDFGERSNKSFSNSLGALLPQKMIDTVVRLSGIGGDKKVNSITKEERRRLVGLLKCFEIKLLRFRPIEEAIITSGGVNVKEIDPRTMGSKLVKDLYFAGEIIDVDAYTGGFNLQIAFSTGALAGASAAE